MIRKMISAAVLGILVTAPSAMALEGRWQGISVQGTGFFTKDSSGNGINQHATDTGGFLLSYRYHFNGWLGADASCGHAPDTQQNFTSSAPLGGPGHLPPATCALLGTAPRPPFRLPPYVLSGPCALA